MGEVAKCTSWLGHKFEARYSKGPVVGSYNTYAPPSHIERIAETMRSVTYERDICARCGATVEKSIPPQQEGKTE